MDWKADLYRKVAPYLGEHTIFASNTSGLSINRLAASFPEQQRPRFCGVHFFNPPRYMHLVELIACDGTEPGILDELERFLVTTLGKGVVRAKDTPNFIANHIGLYGLFKVLQAWEQGPFDIDTIEALTGPAIGRPKSATFRTIDITGLDVAIGAVAVAAPIMLSVVGSVLDIDLFWTPYPFRFPPFSPWVAGSKTRCA